MKSEKKPPSRILLVSYPKIIFLYPTFVVSLLAAIYLSSARQPLDRANTAAIVISVVFLFAWTASSKRRSPATGVSIRCRGSCSGSAAACGNGAGRWISRVGSLSYRNGLCAAPDATVRMTDFQSSAAPHPQPPVQTFRCVFGGLSLPSR